MAPTAPTLQQLPRALRQKSSSFQNGTFAFPIGLSLHFLSGTLIFPFSFLSLANFYLSFSSLLSYHFPVLLRPNSPSSLTLSVLHSYCLCPFQTLLQSLIYLSIDSATSTEQNGHIFLKWMNELVYLFSKTREPAKHAHLFCPPPFWSKLGKNTQEYRNIGISETWKHLHKAPKWHAIFYLCS